ncbi:putative uncharacterized protein DDB_G0274435 [Eupeodes corollae]|uniref:putative uncharacterized protein DDB_G0274435 n=1 Tax=Eupeodes corollae TaxID=290404 RepID=UPI002491986D|nr:putative uncharacterized protein DDB_G0274435 [Eupeodes corollae]
MVKKKRAGVSKDTSADTSGDARTVATAVSKMPVISGYTSDPQSSVKRKRQTPNLIKRPNAAKRAALKGKLPLTLPLNNTGMTSESEVSEGDDSETPVYVSDGGEGRYRSPKNRPESLTKPDPSTNKALEVDVDQIRQEENTLMQALQSKQAAISEFEENLKKLKEEMQPLLSQLKQKQEARRQQEAAQRLLYQKQKQQKQQQQQPQQQHPQSKPASKISGAEQFKKAPPATAGPNVEDPTTSTKAKQRLQEQPKQPQQQPILQQQQQQQKKEEARGCGE